MGFPRRKVEEHVIFQSNKLVLSSPSYGSSPHTEEEDT